MSPIHKLLSRLFRQPRPQAERFVERLERARISGRRFADARSLDTDEAAVVFSASVNSAIFSPIDADWDAASLRELELFRLARARRGGAADQEVNFVEQGDWPEIWANELRMYFLYVPRLEPNGSSLNGLVKSYLQTASGALTSDASTICRLSFVNVYRRMTPWLWKGTELEVRESSGPLELKGIGGNFTKTTVVSFDGSLAAATFDRAYELVERAQSDCPDGSQVWLAIGVPIDTDDCLPAPRPIGRDEVIDNPVCIEPEASRLVLEVLQGTNVSGSPVGLVTITRIMAVEQQ